MLCSELRGQNNFDLISFSYKVLLALSLRRDCVKSLRSSYTGFYPQNAGLARLLSHTHFTPPRTRMQVCFTRLWIPLWSEFSTNKTVTARLWPWLEPCFWQTCFNPFKLFPSRSAAAPILRVLSRAFANPGSDFFSILQPVRDPPPSRTG